MDEFGSRLRKIREARGLSQSELARAAGLHPSLISRMERGERSTPAHGTVVSLAKVLNVTAEQLTGEGPLLPQPPQESEGVDEVLHIILKDLGELMLSIEDLEGVVHMWAALPNHQAIMIADIIALEYVRLRRSKSGKVTRLIPPSERKFDMVTKAKDAYVLGPAVEEIPDNVVYPRMRRRKKEPAEETPRRERESS